MPEHLRAEASAALRRLNVEVFEIQAALAQERRKILEEQRVADDRAFTLGDQRFSGRTRAEQRIVHAFLGWDEQNA